MSGYEVDRYTLVFGPGVWGFVDLLASDSSIICARLFTKDACKDLDIANKIDLFTIIRIIASGERYVGASEEPEPGVDRPIKSTRIVRAR